MNVHNLTQETEKLGIPKRGMKKRKKSHKPNSDQIRPLYVFEPKLSIFPDSNSKKTEFRSEARTCPRVFLLFESGNIETY